MKTNEGKTLATGGWYSKRDCPDNLKRPGVHSFVDVSSKKSIDPKGIKAGERLVTSECKHCGGRVVDCPTIGIDIFSI